MEHWGCVLVSSFLKRCIRSLWNSLLYNYLALYSGGSSGGAWGARPPVLDQNEARRPEKNFFWDRPPLISGSGWPRPPLSQGLDDRAPPYLRVWMTAPPPYLKVWICHCCKSSRINNVIKTNLYGTVQAFLMSYGICLGGLTEQSGIETPNYGFIKWVGKLKLVTTKAD